MFFSTTKEKANLSWHVKVFFFNLQHISLTFINLALNVAEIEVT